MNLGLVGLTREFSVAVNVSKTVTEAKCTSQFCGANRGIPSDVGCEFRLWNIPVVCKPPAAFSAEGNPLLGLRGRQTGWSHCSDVCKAQRRYARTTRHVSIT